MKSWADIAKERFNVTEVIGDGQWCVTAYDSPDRAWLFADRVSARRFIVDENRASITNLAKSLTLLELLAKVPDNGRER
jgi:hypothetical protein